MEAVEQLFPLADLNSDGKLDRDVPSLRLDPHNVSHGEIFA